MTASAPKVSKLSKPVNPPPPAIPDAKRERTDWDAVERDFRTGRFTLRELGAKHSISHAAVGQKARKLGWTQDLTNAVRQATNAKLIEQAVSKGVSDAVQSVSNTVLAAAEVNKQVILGHRQDVVKLRDVTMLAVERLQKDAAKLNDKEKPTDPGELLLSAQRATQSLARLQAMERVAFGLDEEDDPASKDQGAGHALSDAMRAARIAKLVQIAQSRPEPGDVG